MTADCAPPLGQSSSSIGIHRSPTTSFQLPWSLRKLLLPLLVLLLKLYTTSKDICFTVSVRSPFVSAHTVVCPLDQVQSHFLLRGVNISITNTRAKR